VTQAYGTDLAKAEIGLQADSIIPATDIFCLLPTGTRTVQCIRGGSQRSKRREDESLPLQVDYCVQYAFVTMVMDGHNFAMTNDT